MRKLTSLEPESAGTVNHRHQHRDDNDDDDNNNNDDEDNPKKTIPFTLHLTHCERNNQEYVMDY